MTYLKKPVVIKAIRWEPDNAEAVARMQKFLGDSFLNHGGLLQIHTLEGKMEAHAGDWIIRGVKGEFCPCKPDIFEATYEAGNQIVAC